MTPIRQSQAPLNSLLATDNGYSADDQDPRGMKISVVAATYNRRESLLQLLDSLEKQTLPPTAFEIVIANDGSTDGTAEMLAKMARSRTNLRFVNLSNSGPGAARNAGARAACGRYLAFTDDDCIADERWLEQILAAFERAEVVGIQGRTTTDRLKRTPMTHQMEVLRHWPAALPTCNAAYLKEVFDRVGGFDSGFKFAHNEDADLSWRVEEFGEIIFAPGVHIIHPPRRDKFWKRARWVRYLESDFYLFYKNPLKYQKYISSSPWVTIYWKVTVWEQYELAKLCVKCLLCPFHPLDAIAGFGVVLARWFNLIRFLPDYLRAQSKCRAKFTKSSK